MLTAGLVVLAACGSSGDSSNSSAAVSSTAAGSSGPTTSGSTGSQPSYVPAVSAAVQTVMKDNVIPGSVVLISSPDQGDWTGTFGTGTLGEQDPMVVGDHFRIGSNT